MNEQVIMQKILPNELTLADITAILKKDDFMLAKNKRPISVLPWISKIFEKRIENSYFNTEKNFRNHFYVVIEKILVLRLPC